MSNFGELPKGDIREIKASEIPDHDVLVAGFPCQPFSIAGKKGGFENTRGTLFFEIARILKEKKPKIFILENVKGLVNHDKGRTLSTILGVLRKDLHYTVPNPEVLNASDFGLPQKRQRIIIVGFREDLNADAFNYPLPIKSNVVIKDILEKDQVSVKYFLSDTYLNCLKLHKERQMSKGYGFGYEIKSECDRANVLVIGGMGKERNLIKDKKLSVFKPVTKIRGNFNTEYIRRMTPREWARLKGFPDKFIIPVSDTQAYKQFANSVPIPMIKAVARQAMNVLWIRKSAPAIYKIQ